VLYRDTPARITEYVIHGGLVSLAKGAGDVIWTAWNANDVDWAPATVDMVTESQE